MKKKFICPLLIALACSGCSGGKLDLKKALSVTKIAKNENYKQRPGWEVANSLLADDCKVSKSNGESLLNWNDEPCEKQNSLESVFSKIPKDKAPIFYLFYHEVSLSDRDKIIAYKDDNLAFQREMEIFALRMSQTSASSSSVARIYNDYQIDAWSMGLPELNEEEFKESLSSFSKSGAALQANINSITDEISKRNAKNESRKSEEAKRAALESEVEVTLSLWSNPLPSQLVILNAFKGIAFSKKSDGWLYANGKKFIPLSSLSELGNVINISLSDCIDAGAYTGHKEVEIYCAEGIARGIADWGKTAKTVSEKAWWYGRAEGIISYNPIKYEILFSHWAGMARLYSSRGY